jgi:hypothetical protein
LVDSFGNLCLISHGKNSRLSNFMPVAKTEHYRNNRMDSIKRYLMKQSEEWNVDMIRVHGEDMTRVPVDSLQGQDTRNVVAS